MDQLPINQNQPDRAERIILGGSFRVRYRYFAAFLICAALLIAAFAVSSVWGSQGGGEWLQEHWGSFWGSGGQDENPFGDGTTVADGSAENDGTTEALLEDDPPLPDGATPVISADLSYLSLGEGYLHNTTAYTPDISALLSRDIRAEVGNDPLVLILHTHTSECYAEGGISYFDGVVGDVTYSRETERNVLAVGETLCRTLNENGIVTIHCTAMHDDPTLSGSYDRAAESIRFYLEQYPSIRYVIDLHRDAILNSNGEYIRAVTDVNGEATAQVMAVVGTDGGGLACDGWEDNLALALQLRASLNAEETTLCRPVCLRKSTYNQEIAPYSLLLEIGTGANSVEEAQRAAVLVGQALAALIRGQ
ncbi:MAG: stage II sporulation protein P [Clostridia bacterium]|nr:stage II sporulation protein P [Clostridia bacterium]